MSGTVPAQQRTSIDQTSIDALQDVLETEHAALWAYSLVVAYLPTDLAQRAREDSDAHRRLRGLIEQTLSDVGARPVSALPSYKPPTPVTGSPTAQQLAVVAETDTLAAWRSLLERTSDTPLRAAALEALVAGTARCTRWRTSAGLTPVVPTFPGRT
ncbi:ferritin-like domain-containing protein [Pseudonocardia sp.]|uniref:ferritin-like domain-containing protein n=1 Tax=Pseudonocardia sp. TaxID=60912 RepID=UPI003D0E869B